MWYNLNAPKKKGGYTVDGVAIELILIMLVALGASLIQSVTGFGFGIFAMIFLPSLLSFTEANLISTVLSTLTSLAVVLLTFRQVNFRNLIFPTLGCLASTYLAVEFISVQSNDTLKLLLGIALFLLSVYFFFFSDKIRIKPTFYAGLLAGVISGIMGGMFAIGGPPVVIYYMQSERDSKSYLSTISAYFVFSGIISAVSKALSGFVTDRVYLSILVGALGMIVGALLGKLTRDKVKPEGIRRAVYAVMAISGLINIVTSIV